MYLRPVYCAGVTRACKFAYQELKALNYPILDAPDWNTGHLLLDVPSFRPGLWPEGMIDTLLSSLPRDICIWGGGLTHPSLSGYRAIDLLRNEEYLEENAAITAACTIPIAESLLSHPWNTLSVLVIGWGRISKSLAGMLSRLGCSVTISSRNSLHLDEIAAMGYCSFPTQSIRDVLPAFHLIINTAPGMVLSRADAHLCMESIKIDLASVKGIEGDDVHWERALPSRFAPEASGKLIARIFTKLVKEDII